MAILRTQFPFPSTSNLQFPYDMFLSFRGADTCLKFTCYLYTTLKSAGFETFRDDLINRGEKIYLELKKAIKNSSMSIIVFSEKYVSSSNARLFEVETILQHNTVRSQNILFSPSFIMLSLRKYLRSKRGIV